MLKDTLYLSDLDGALLQPDGTLSSFVAQTLNRLVARGLHFGCATARSLVTARQTLRGLTTNIPMAFYNGTFAFDGADGRNLVSNSFPSEETAAVRRVLTALEISPVVYYFRADERCCPFAGV